MADENVRKLGNVHSIQAWSERQFMKERIKAAFKQAIDKYEASATAAKQGEAKKLTERQGFEIEYRRVRDNVIIPALKEVANDLLEPAGWKCDIRQDEKDIETTLEVYRDDMEPMSGEGRGGPSHPYELGAITEDVIHRELLNFFQRLASER
jgi:hypothetical protein